MAYKSKEDAKAYAAKHYQENKELYAERARKSRRRLRVRNQEFIRKYKESNPCVDCKQYFHYSQMDFDHIGAKTKNVSRFTNTSHSIKAIESEIKECELVCANCHRLRTWKRRT
jgi:hypothetical protein